MNAAYVSAIVSSVTSLEGSDRFVGTEFWNAGRDCPGVIFANRGLAFVDGVEGVRAGAGRGLS